MLKTKTKKELKEIKDMGLYDDLTALSDLLNIGYVSSHKGYYPWRDYNEVEEHTYVSIKTPPNCLGYEDTILFNHGEPYTLHRYLQPWILNACKEALIKKGYGDLL